MSSLSSDTAPTHLHIVKASLSAAGPFYSSPQHHHEVSFHPFNDETTAPNNHGCIIIKTPTYLPGLSIPSYQSHIVAQLQQSSLYCSRQPSHQFQTSKSRPIPHVPSNTSGTNTLLVMRCSSIPTTCSNHLSTVRSKVRSTLLATLFLFLAILRTPSLRF